MSHMVRYRVEYCLQIDRDLLVFCNSDATSDCVVSSGVTVVDSPAPGADNLVSTDNTHTPARPMQQCAAPPSRPSHVHTLITTSVQSPSSPCACHDIARVAVSRTECFVQILLKQSGPNAYAIF